MIQDIPLFSMEALTFGAFLILGIYFGVLYLFQRFQLEALFLSIFSGLMVIRILVTGNKSLTFLIPGFSVEYMTRIECISSVMLFLVFIMLARSLYKYMLPLGFQKAVSILLFIYSLLVLFISYDLLLEIRPFMGYFIVLLLGYILFLSWNNITKDRDDAWIFFISTVIILFFYLYTFYQSMEEVRFVSWGYIFILVFLGLHTLLVSKRSYRHFQRTEVLSLEIKNSNQLAQAMNANYEKFVPKKFFQYLDKESVSEIRLGDNTEKVLTVQFTQIQDFWNIVRGIPSENIFRFLNSYLSRVSPCILNNNGIIDKFIDNTILAIYPEDPGHAIKSAIEYQWEIEVYNIHRKKTGYETIQCGSGIHHGVTRIGIIGEENRRELTVISDTVNLASRIQGLSEKYGARILVSLPTIYQSSGLIDINFRMLDMVRVKGKKDHVSIGEILIPRIDTVTDLKIDTKHDFEEGIVNYIRGEFAYAKELFEQVWKKNPGDIAAKMYYDRAVYFIETGSSEDFEGIHQWESK